MSFIYQMLDTWNAIGTTFNSIYMNTSDGAGGPAVGAAASRLLRLDNNSSRVFDIDIEGKTRIGNPSLSAFATAYLTGTPFLDVQALDLPAGSSSGTNNGVIRGVAEYIAVTSDSTPAPLYGVCFASPLAATTITAPQVRAGDFDMLVSGGGNLTGIASSIITYAEHDGSGTVEHLALLNLCCAGTGGGGGTVNHLSSIYIPAGSLYSPEAIDQVGLRIGDFDESQANLWSIYTGTGYVSFSGPTIVGSNTRPTGAFSNNFFRFLVLNERDVGGFGYASFGVASKAQAANGYTGAEVGYFYMPFGSSALTELYSMGGETQDEANPGTNMDFFFFDNVHSLYKMGIVSSGAAVGSIRFGNMSNVLASPTFGNGIFFDIDGTTGWTLTTSTALVGNVANYTNLIYAPGDPVNVQNYPYNPLFPIGVFNSYFSGDLSGADTSGIKVYFGMKHTGASNATSYGIDFEPTINSDSTGPYQTFNGAWYSPVVYGTCTIANIYGIEIYPDLEGAATVSIGMYGIRVGGTNTGGTIGTSYGVFITQLVQSGGGVTTNNYGLYLEDQSGIATTLNYNIYSAGAGINYFGGGAIFNNNVIFNTDAMYDIGASGANRPRDIYVYNRIFLDGGVNLSAFGYFGFSGRGFITAPADGVLFLQDAASTSFNLLQFGGTTSSYPAWGRDGAGMQLICADGTTGTFLSGVEQTAPSAPAANGYRIYAQDNGGGKTQLMVIFNTGAAQQIAIQP